jgi:hypothetical protein
MDDVILVVYLAYHIFYLVNQFVMVADDKLDAGEGLLSDVHLLQVVQGESIHAAAVQAKALTSFLDHFNTFRNFHGILTLLCAIELFGLMQFNKSMSVILNALLQAKESLVTFFISCANNPRRLSSLSISNSKSSYFLHSEYT